MKATGVAIANSELIVLGERAVPLAMATIKVGIAAKTVLLPALRKMNQELTKRVGDGRENFEADEVRPLGRVSARRL